MGVECDLEAIVCMSCSAQARGSRWKAWGGEGCSHQISVRGSFPEAWRAHGRPRGRISGAAAAREDPPAVAALALVGVVGLVQRGHRSGVCGQRVARRVVSRGALLHERSCFFPKKIIVRIGAGANEGAWCVSVSRRAEWGGGGFGMKFTPLLPRNQLRLAAFGILPDCDQGHEEHGRHRR